MSVALVEAPTPTTPNTREERLGAALDRFALSAGASVSILADDDGLAFAASSGTDAAHAELWAAGAARALEAAAAVQRLARRFGPVEAVIALDGDRHLFAHQLRAPAGPLTAIAIGPRSVSRDVLTQLERGIAEALEGY